MESLKAGAEYQCQIQDEQWLNALLQECGPMVRTTEGYLDKEKKENRRGGDRTLMWGAKSTSITLYQTRPAIQDLNT